MARRRFEDKVVLVTGGTSGLGLATCALFLTEGAKLFVTDLLKRDVLSTLSGSNKSPNIHFQTCDVSSPSSCASAVSACIAKLSRIDVLFHNGARLADLGTVVDQDIATFDAVVRTNLSGLFYLSRAVIPPMKAQATGGSIVVTASTAGLFGDYGLCSYSAAKAGSVNLVRTMALDHARDGIRLNAVCPGYMVTPMTEGFRSEKHVHEALLESIPLNRGAQPEEVGSAVLFFGVG
ncbi:Putative short-chain dehydrogenase/reductase SDR, NAD(P)-binding domain superfamily [Septoria linicola]|uniref:Short-chain dehydrogenase/reductase SDR, NAD(P)-binding domain superfamily n=1 Tax=Septoria linicola TaxID=215465 RepID=A0A9Q9AUB0_9PEZI|nr:Putative short-chain dehydrogenase/reductase SDR, NAD(P)-binding domain superfamily [Septoria linicola]